MIEKLVIVARDVSGWITALACARALRSSNTEITVIELPTTLEDIDVTVIRPPVKALHKLLGLNELALLKTTSGSFSLGHKVTGFAVDRSFFLPYETLQSPIQDAKFLGAWADGKRQGMPAEYQDFSVVAVAALQGKFFRPEEERVSAPGSDYGYHLKSLDYCALLKAQAMHMGVLYAKARSILPHLEPDASRISYVATDSGGRFEADLYVDASGESAVLAGGMTSPSRPSSGNGFPGTAIATLRMQDELGLPPFSETLAIASGYAVLTPVQGCTTASVIFDANLSSVQDAIVELASATQRTASTEVVIGELSRTARSAAWLGNCVAIGEAVAAVDKVGGFDLTLCHIGIARLVVAMLDPDGKPMTEVALEYNDQIARAVECIRDYQLSWHYLARERQGAFWHAAGKAAFPPSVLRRLSRFLKTGLIDVESSDPVCLDDWYGLFAGYGLVPSAPSGIDISDSNIKAAFKARLAAISRSVDAMGSHDIYVEMNCAEGMA